MGALSILLGNGGAIASGNTEIGHARMHGRYIYVSGLVLLEDVRARYAFRICTKHHTYIHTMNKYTDRYA